MADILFNPKPGHLHHLRPLRLRVWPRPSSGRNGAVSTAHETCCLFCSDCLVGGLLWMIIPHIWKNKTCSKPPTRTCPNVNFISTSLVYTVSSCIILYLTYLLLSECRSNLFSVPFPVGTSLSDLLGSARHRHLHRWWASEHPNHQHFSHLRCLGNSDRFSMELGHVWARHGDAAWNAWKLGCLVHWSIQHLRATRSLVFWLVV